MSYNNSPYHSLHLRQFFPINKVGVDYVNPFNINIEFKETFSNNPNFKNVNIKITQNQFNDNDLIVVCFQTTKFYVHNSKVLGKKHCRPNSYGRTTLRATSLQKNYMFETNNYIDLKKYLDNIQEV